MYFPRIEAKRISLSGDYDRSAQVTGLTGEVRQVISNLIANAIDALPDGGILRIRVHRSIELSYSGRTGARIMIADSGSEIRPEQRKKIFEPFYTTKQDVGTGLGLWVSQEIVRKHGGSISLRSSIGPDRSGTAFSIFLPAEPVVAINAPNSFRAVS